VPGEAAEQPPPTTLKTFVVNHGGEGVGTRDAHDAGCSESPLAATAGRPPAAVARVLVGASRGWGLPRVAPGSDPCWDLLTMTLSFLRRNYAFH
jgi:hypothetical protein